MTDHDKLHEFKTIAKRYARAWRVPHHEGLDWVASEAGYPHWKAFTNAWARGIRPNSTIQDALQNQLEAAVSDTTSNTLMSEEPEGIIDGRSYEVSIDLEAVVHGDGWAICLGEAPSEAPRIEIYGNRAAVPITDPTFRQKVMKIAEDAAEVLRSRIASDWPRRSTKPDAQGRIVHPLWASRELSSEWHCLHCDGVFSGKQIAENMWHCPNCNATPIDIFAAPFWKEAS